jgi:hypothetical protein
MNPLVCILSSLPDLDLLFTPFGLLPSLSVQFRTLSDLNLFPHSTLSKAIDTCVKNLKIPPDSVANLNDLSRVLPSLLPWFEDYKRLLLSFAALSEHESFLHPVVCTFKKA